MTEKNIIDGCRKGDSAARRMLYESYGGMLYAICCRYVRDRVIAEDLLQDTLVTIFTKIGSFRENGSFEGWCRRIAVNTVLSHLRKSKKARYELEIENAIQLSDSDADIISQISSQEIIEVISKLPEGYRTILNLYAVEGYSHKEIGEMLSIGESSSRSQYSRARSKLVKMLRNRGIDR